MNRKTFESSLNAEEDPENLQTPLIKEPQSSDLKNRS